MQNEFKLRKANRKQIKLRIGLFGPSGSGKTMSALKLARGITNWSKVAIIDTESGSAELYSHLGEYNVVPLEPPYSPERYIEAIKACEDAGMEVIIIDSISHEWSGQGGILELADTLEGAAKNSFIVWGKLTPRHNRFIDTILQSSALVICCGRTKQDYVLNQVEKNGKTINVPEKIGLKAITREGFDYEMTLSFDIAINHYASTNKDRTGLFMGRPEFVINENVGKEIIKWNSSGEVLPPDYTVIKRKIIAEAKRIGVDVKSPYFKAKIEELTKLELKEENYDSIYKRLCETNVLPKDSDKKEPPQGNDPLVDDNVGASLGITKKEVNDYEKEQTTDTDELTIEQQWYELEELAVQIDPELKNKTRPTIEVYIRAVTRIKVEPGNFPDIKFALESIIQNKICQSKN